MWKVPIPYFPVDSSRLLSIRPPSISTEPRFVRDGIRHPRPTNIHLGAAPSVLNHRCEVIWFLPSQPPAFPYQRRRTKFFSAQECPGRSGYIRAHAHPVDTVGQPFNALAAQNPWKLCQLQALPTLVTYPYQFRPCYQSPVGTTFRSCCARCVSQPRCREGLI
jgi:hypothetical protein